LLGAAAWLEYERVFDEDDSTNLAYHWGYGPKSVRETSRAGNCRAVDFAISSLTNRLPSKVRYMLRAEVVDVEEAIQRLWQPGSLPVWIDVGVESADDNFTYLRIYASSGRVESDAALRYQSLGYPPFQWLGPPQPFGWKGVDQSGRFDLNWRGSNRG
jgi:hypothetical protein